METKVNPEVIELRQRVAGMTPEQVQSPAGKALARRLIRMDYESWCRYRMRKVNRVPAKHHQLIIRTVQELLDGEYLPIRRVLIMTPPGSAKSTYTSLLIPPWYLNPLRCPNDLILSCSYSYSLVEGFGRQARDMVEEESDVLGISLSKTASASGDWRTNKNGGYFCAGVAAGIAGHRARFGVIDDFAGTEEEVQSKPMRDKTWAWYFNDFYPRLLPDAYQLLICNHRHEDDLAGRMLTDPKESKKWLVIKLPMLAEENDPLGRQPGEILWPEWFTYEMIESVRNKPETWSGLYQQRPSPEEGNFFKKDWLVTYRPSDLPKNLRMYVGSDFAVRENQQSDSFFFVAAGMDENGRLWVLPDWWWEQSDTGQAVDKMFELANRHHPVAWFAGRENITGSIGPFIYKRMMETGQFFTIEEISEARDKQQKAQSIRARMSAKMVMFPEYAPGWEAMRHQLLTFPNGTHDDVIDGLAKLGQGLDKMMPASVQRTLPAMPSEPPVQRITARWVQDSHNRRERESRLALADN